MTKRIMPSRSGKEIPRLIVRRAAWVLVLLMLAWAGITNLSAEPEAATNAPMPAAAAVHSQSRTNSMPLEAYETWLTFGLDQVPILQHRGFAGIPLWQYIASIIYIFLAFVAARLVDFIIRDRLRKWAARTESKLDDMLLDLLQGPIKVVAFVILLYLGIRIYSWPPLLESVISKSIVVILAVAVTYVLLKMSDIALNVWHARTVNSENDSLGRELLPLIRRTLKLFIVIVAILVTSQNLGFNVTGLIASLSIGGLAVGLAAQDTLANMFGAVAVLVDKPFRVGDRILIENTDGFVETIGFRSTRVRNLDGHLVVIPNKTMGNATIINISRRPNIKTVMNIGVTYDTPPGKVKEALDILGSIYKGNPMTEDVWLSFDRFADSSLNLLVIHWWKSTDYKEYLGGMRDMNLEIKRRFEAAGIEFAFPSRTIYLKQDGGNGVLPEAVRKGLGDGGNDGEESKNRLA